MTFQRITSRDKPESMAEKQARYEALLSEAVLIAKERAKTKSTLVQEILETTVVEGNAAGLETETSALVFRAKKYKRIWIRIQEWKYLESSTPEEEADSILDTLEANIHMTETNSWPTMER